MKKFTVILVTLALTLIVLSGCQTTSQPNANANGNGGGFNANQMLQQIDTGLKSLVSNGTITQEQSDKIKTLLDSRFQNQNRQRFSASGRSPQNWSGSRPAFNPNGSRPSFGGGNGGGRMGGGFNMLSSLVNDGTITQDQADKVTQAIFGNMQFGRGQNGQGN